MADFVGKSVKGGLKRFGTMLSRRRQSTLGAGFGRSPSPTKEGGSFHRFSGSHEGPSPPSRRQGSGTEKGHRLSVLPEMSPLKGIVPSNFAPLTPLKPGDVDSYESTPQEESTRKRQPEKLPDLSGVSPPPGPPPSQANGARVDSEGFSEPPTANDPITLAQKAASESEAEQAFKLNIRSEPIQEEDGEAQAAISSVASALRAAVPTVTPTRRAGTVRGRRDVRNTMYIAPPELSSIAIPERAPAGPVAGLAAMAGASDAGSIRSARSMGGAVAAKHPELRGPGLQSSVIETVSAHFEEGILRSLSVVGELALVCHGGQGECCVSLSVRAG
jgi:hypothetical protein